MRINSHGVAIYYKPYVFIFQSIFKASYSLFLFIFAGSLIGEMKAVTSDQALAASIINRPQDNSADVVVDVVLTPSYVYYKASTVDRVVKFFTPPSELRSLDFSGLSAAATSQLERARKAAAEYAAAALSNKPRLRMKLDLEAPKVAIPVEDSDGKVSLALDLGRFIIETDPATAASLPPEEAGLYECIHLVGSNVSAYVVDGSFDWAALGQDKSSPKLVPLLDRCGMEVGLQAARYPEPKYPTLRLSPTVPVLHFHLSPGRIGRLLRVINGALPPPSTGLGPSELTAPSSTPGPATLGVVGSGEGEEGDEDGAGAEGWRARADFEGPIKVLTWTGLGRTTASWCPRYAVLYQGKIYLYEHEHGSKVVSTLSIWPDRVVLPVPPEYVAQCPHVLAIRNAGPAVQQDLQHVAEDSSSTVLRCESEDAAQDWYRNLLSAQQALQGIAGGVPAPTLNGDVSSWEATSTISSSEAEEVDQASSSLEKLPSGETKQGEEGPIGPSTMLQVNATLGEFAIFMSGREPSLYWPPNDLKATDLAHVETAETTEEGVSGGSATPYALAIDSGEIDGEVALIALRASGGSLSFEYGAFGMTVHTALGSLEILDILVGNKNPKYCFLATSSKPGAGAITVDEEIFFDPSTTSQELPRSLSELSGASNTPRKGSEPASPFGKQDLAEFTLKLRRPGTKEYDGIDTFLEAKLNKLFFFCNRPTVAALISMGLDVSAAASAAFNRDSSDGGVLNANTAGGDGDVGTPTSDSGFVTTTIQASEEDDGSGDVASMALEKIEGLKLLSDTAGGRRTMFAMSVTLETLQVVLNYEGAVNDSIAEACITDFSFDLSIAPDGAMDITSALGNLSAVSGGEKKLFFF